MTHRNQNRQAHRHYRLAALLLVTFISGCASTAARHQGVATTDKVGPELTPMSETRGHLLSLPEPMGKIPVSVYGFRDQTGQYKPAPASSFSTAVSQGAGSMLIKALFDSGWFIPLEREGLQDLLTERKIIRAAEAQKSAGEMPMSPLLTARIMLQGGIIGYDSNVRTGGAGAKYLGIGVSDQYRVDQVSINLRAVDVLTGRILATVSTSNTIYSKQLKADVFRYVRFKTLAEFEAGTTRNEPVQLVVNETIEAAVLHLIGKGIRDNLWNLKQAGDIDSEVLAPYLVAGA